MIARLPSSTRKASGQARSTVSAPGEGDKFGEEGRAAPNSLEGLVLGPPLSKGQCGIFSLTDKT